MTKAWLAFCLASAASFAKAEEATFAWHFATSPEERLREYSEKPEVLAEPPGATVFAGRGDRLIDLSGQMRKALEAGNETWLIWNETRHLLIVHGEARAIAYAAWESKYAEQPKAAAITLSWYQEVGLGDAVPEKAEPSARLELICPAGKKSSGSWSLQKPGPLAAVTCEIDPFFGGDGNHFADVRYDLKWTENTGSEPLEWNLQLSNLLDTLNSKPRTIAQATSPHGGTWTITASAKQQFIDGFPSLESQWVEVAGKAVPKSRLTPWPKLPKEQAGDSGLFLRDYDMVSLDYLARGLDPVGEGKEMIPAKDLVSQLPNAAVPDGLRGYAELPMVDLKPFLRKRGAPMDEPCFAGYEVSSGRVLVGFSREELFRQADIMESTNCGPTSVMAITFRERQEGQADPLRAVMIRGRKGETGSLSCRAAKEPPPKKADGTEDEEEEEEEAFLLNCKLSASTVARSPGFESTEIRYEVTMVGFASSPAITSKGDAIVVPGSETVLSTYEAGDHRATQTIHSLELPLYESETP